jgi:hypothetical protein
MNKLFSRLLAGLIGIDQAFNGFINGYPDETLSAACHRKAKYGKKRWIYSEIIVDILFFWDREVRKGKVYRHCQLSYESEILKRHFPEEYKKRL